MNTESTPTEVNPQTGADNKVSAHKESINYQLAAKIRKVKLDESVTLFEKDKGRKPNGWGNGTQGNTELVNWLIEKVSIDGNTDNAAVTKENELLTKTISDKVASIESMAIEISELKETLLKSESLSKLQQENINSLMEFALVYNPDLPEERKKELQEVLTFIQRRIKAGKELTTLEVVEALYTSVAETLSKRGGDKLLKSELFL